VFQYINFHFHQWSIQSTINQNLGQTDQAVLYQAGTWSVMAANSNWASAYVNQMAGWSSQKGGRCTATLYTAELSLCCKVKQSCVISVGVMSLCWFSLGQCGYAVERCYLLWHVCRRLLSSDGQMMYTPFGGSQTNYSLLLCHQHVTPFESSSRWSAAYFYTEISWTICSPTG
jgi:hypothetical protein